MPSPSQTRRKLEFGVVLGPISPHLVWSLDLHDTQWSEGEMMVVRSTKEVDVEVFHLARATSRHNKSFLNERAGGRETIKG
jgi:hypothetical protein